MGINHLCYHPNKNIVVPICSSYPPKNDGTNDCSAAIIALNKTSPVSNPIPANQAHTDINNDDDSQFFTTPRKHNHSYTDTRYSNTTTNLVQLNVYQSICQQIPSITTTSLKSLHLKNSILVFKWTENVLMQNSVPNQEH